MPEGSLVSMLCPVSCNECHRTGMAKLIEAPLQCQWDNLADRLDEANEVCCGEDPNRACARGDPPRECSPLCAVTFHKLISDCGDFLLRLAGDDTGERFTDFDGLCTSEQSVDQGTFLRAIANAECASSLFFLPSEKKYLKVHLHVGIPPCPLPEDGLTFTTLDGNGRSGPTSTDAYQDTDLGGEEVVQLEEGLQIWTVPSTASYTIIAAGARGGSHHGQRGGRGAVMQGDFHLEEGTRLRILVGQEGTSHECGGCDWGSGGGGGTFVVIDPEGGLGAVQDDNILIIAGGGAGTADNGGMGDNGDGNDLPDGNLGTCGAQPGHDGQGGRSEYASGGAGFRGDGEYSCCGAENGPRAFVNGGRGAIGNNIHGGFGGGGGPYDGGGGGGGYSGGAGCNGAHSGGGGSMNNGENQINIHDAGYNNDAGYVNIKCVAE